MIDTSRHFLPLATIFQSIDTLMYAKMSVMHWHMVDEDSFPVAFPSHPEIATGGAFSDLEIYSAEDLKKIVEYAATRGVKVVPELDVPAHASSWGRYTANRDIACPSSAATFMGSLDTTWDRTYKVLRDVVNDTLKIFPSKHIHLGADEYVTTCQKNKSAISPDPLKAFMRRMVDMVAEIDPARRVMFWYNSEGIVEGSHVQWWGGGWPGLRDTKADIVLAYYPGMYLDTGVNNYLGWNYGPYNDWKELYSFTLPDHPQIIGAEGPLWSEINNQHTQMLKLWPRTLAINLKLWSKNQTRPL
jgi:hexosaminidase